jgi:hypothetical protein
MHPRCQDGSWAEYIVEIKYCFADTVFDNRQVIRRSATSLDDFQ